jgi:hypothetical protein
MHSIRERMLESGSKGQTGDTSEAQKDRAGAPAKERKDWDLSVEGVPNRLPRWLWLAAVGKVLALLHGRDAFAAQRGSATGGVSGNVVSAGTTADKASACPIRESRRPEGGDGD